MGSFTMSKAAVHKAITYSKEAHEKLAYNAKFLNEQVNRQFVGLKDPTYISYLELSTQMQDLLGQIGHKMGAIVEYCEKIDHWIDTYNEI